jgi:hypothetical protein
MASSAKQLRITLGGKVSNSTDPVWKQQLLDDPEATLSVEDFPELKRVEELQQSTQQTSWEAGVAEHGRPNEPEVAGHVMPNPYELTSRQQGFCCPFYTIRQTVYC